MRLETLKFTDGGSLVELELLTIHPEKSKISPEQFLRDNYAKKNGQNQFVAEDGAYLVDDVLEVISDISDVYEKDTKIEIKTFIMIR